MVAGLRPAFVRWPGGCFVEGIAIDTRPQWKRSLGRLEDRPGTYSPWGYWSSDGFGYHEFLQFSEDLGADALYVANAGVSCAFRSGTFIPDDQLAPLIQDTLDAIEYAIGPVTSTWGALRAKNGHPTPFPLKYVEIGNEQQGPRYGERVKRFTAVIKKRSTRRSASHSARGLPASIAARSTPPARSTSWTSTRTRGCTGRSRTSTASQSTRARAGISTSASSRPTAASDAAISWPRSTTRPT